MNGKPSQSNRIQSTGKVAGLLNEYYAEMFDGRKVCYCIGPVPHEILDAAGVAGFLVENTAARIAAAQEQLVYIQAAESEGLGTDTCSYAKINLGQALMMLNGLESQIPQKFRIPKPDMVAVFNACPTMLQWARCLSELFDVPLFGGDVPFFYDRSQWRDNVEYVKRQLLEFVAFLEKQSNQPLDWEQLNEAIRKVSEMSTYRRDIKEACKTIPAPASFIDSATAMGPALSIRNQKTVELYRDFAEEVADRTRKRIGVLQNEKYRLMWRGNFPWFKMGWFSRLLAKHQAVIVSGTYGFWTYGDFNKEMLPPHGIDVTDPLLTIAAENATGGGYTQSLDWKLEKEFRQHIDGYSIDAVIIHSPFTCRPWALATFDMADWVQKEYGIPALVLDSDHTDARYFQEAQVETRIEALLEAVDAMRESRATTLVSGEVSHPGAGTDEDQAK